MQVEEVLKRAEEARDSGASRFCMGAAWRKPTEHDFDYVLRMVRGVKELGL